MTTPSGSKASCQRDTAEQTLPMDVRRFISGALRFEHLMSELHGQESE